VNRSRHLDLVEYLDQKRQRAWVLLLVASAEQGYWWDRACHAIHVLEEWMKLKLPGRMFSSSTSCFSMSNAVKGME
jgi:hypothetical protein